MPKAEAKQLIQVRHSKDRATPFPLYMRLKLHGDVGLKNMIGNVGILVTYNTVRGTKLGLARAVCWRIGEDGAVLLMNLRRGIFIITFGDNLSLISGTI